MLRYSLAKLASRPKGTSVALAPVAGRLSAEKAYHRALRSMLDGMAAEVRESILPRYGAELNSRAGRRPFTADVEGIWFSRLEVLVFALQRIASDTVKRILGLEAKRHDADFMAAAKRALGVDLTAVVREEDLEDYLRMAAERNASLIKSLSDDMVKRVQQATYDAYLNGRPVTALRKQLQEQFGIGDRRARLIARDQTAKLNSDLNRIRQEQAGVTSYTWMTSHDERVRERHRKLDGKVYKWGEPTGAEEGLPPGKPIQCRCIARGVVEF